ncbi:hypothetical protein ABG768_003118 [Culter alburnus]|uniref:Uncharacterized protein n=1 Tax=Culter alburnus TaxID=194366 RepID=A0AAW2A7X1_CULAL
MVHYAAAENDHLCAGTRGHLSRQQLMAPSAPLGPAGASQLSLAFICVCVCVCVTAPPLGQPPCLLSGMMAGGKELHPLYLSLLQKRHMLLFQNACTLTLMSF